MLQPQLRPTPVQPEFLTVRQLAKMAQLHPNTVYRLAADGKIAGTKHFGRAVRFLRSQALSWTREQYARRDMRSPI